ncbi:MAG: LptF/LptG family permease [Alphaproteobacteria bacterium]
MKSYVFPRYLAKLLSSWFGILAFAFSFIILLFNTIELLRRTHNHSHITLRKILPISLMELPNLLDQLTPFMFLFATMFVLWNLSRKSELVVVRAAGFSIWSVLNPLALSAAVYGVLYLILLNPFISLTHREADRVFGKVFGQSRDLSALSKTGVWLRQSEENSYTIVHIGTVENTKSFKNITLYNFSQDSDFFHRIDSPQAFLTEEGWLLKNASLSESNELIEDVGDYLWSTDLTMTKLQQSLDSPYSMSVWKLPGFITLMEESGFLSHEYKLHFYTLLLKPILFISMVLLGGIVAFQNSRRQNGLRLIITGLFMGFGLYLLHYLFYSLGKTSAVPIWISACAPTFISLLVAIILLLHLEERPK